MESNNVNTASAVAEPSKTIDNTSYLCKIECSIRRKPSTVGLPGQDPAERVYKIGASLDSRTRGNLKGISGDLENMFMPEIIGLGVNDPLFRKGIEEYWSSISRVVPHDEKTQKEHEMGLIITINFHLLTKARKERFDALVTVQEKMELLNKLLVTYRKDANGNETTQPVASLQSEFVANFLLLNYCLKYSKVANNITQVDASPKIDFYIFEKAVSVKNQLNLIELRKEAMIIYQSLEEEPKKIDAVLLHFNEKPSDYDNSIDKLLRIDELYNLRSEDKSNPASNMKKFVDFASDKRWETKYIISSALLNNKLRSPVNTSAVYYGDIYLGSNLEESAMYLDSEDKGKEIKQILLRELKII